MMPALATALTIAGSDPSGGAGIQADLKTFHRLGVYGQSAVTLITAQNTRGVSAVHLLPVELVTQQITAALDDIGAQAIKTGALGSPELIRAVAAQLRGRGIPLVVDPVLISKHGHPLAGPEAVAALTELLTLATVVTPNWHEAAALSGQPVTSMEEARRAAHVLLARGLPLADAALQAKAFIAHAIVTAPGLGGGYGPVNHWA